MSDIERNAAPVADRRPVTRTHHGDVVVDDYEWLRDSESEDVLAHLNAENVYTDARTAHLEALRGRVFEEIRSRTRETDLSVPVREGEWWYFSRSREGHQYPAHVRVPAGDGWEPPVVETGTVFPGEQLLLDEETEAEGLEFYRLGSFDVSRDGARLLHAADTEGDERYLLRVRDLTAGADLADEIPGTSAGAVFSPDGEYVFYTTVDEAWRPDTVWRHRVGTAASDDVVVLSEPDERFWADVGVTRSGAFIEIALGSKITAETLLIPSATPEAEPVVVWPRRHGVDYEVEHAVVAGEDVLLVVHNHEAENYALCAVPVADLEGDPELRGPEASVVVLPHDPAVRLEGVDAFRDRLAVEYREGGITRIATIELGPDAALDSLELRPVAFDEEIYSVGFSGNPEWTQPLLRLGYGSFVTPSRVYDLDPADGGLTLLKEQPVLRGYDPSDYVQERDWATAEDGTRIPLSIVRRRDAASGPLPTLIYGYGSYEASMDPAFSVARLSLLDRGAAFVVAHVRGGGEMGRRWYEDGKTLSKRNTFTDFVAAARHLVETGRTTPAMLVAEGRSAGGLLMGAALNLAPELFAGIHAGVAFVDTLRTILDPGLPLTVVEWDEWGNPLEDPEVYAYMKSYSPYDNVREGVAYPRILATTSLNDTRVSYTEPAKWAARLRSVGADVLLRIEMHAGHGGVSGRYAAWHERAWELAWILDVLGLAEDPRG